MIEQLVIAAGGTGTRIPSSMNPRGNKCLMRYKGKYILEYVIGNAQEAGISEFFISVNDVNKDLVDEICRSMRIRYYLSHPTASFVYVPLMFEDFLEGKFFLICGHQPIPPHHYDNMIASSQTDDLVATAYPITPTKGNRKRIVVKGELQRGVALEQTEAIGLNDTYLSSPYLIDTDIIQELKEHPGIPSLSEVFYSRFKLGTKIGIVPASMPPEFDTVGEFLITIANID